MLFYKLKIEPDDNGAYLVTSPDLPEVVTWSERLDDDLARNAANAVEEAIAARIAVGMDLPEPTAVSGDPVARIPLLSAVKALLYIACQSQGVTRAELARRLGWRLDQVDRLLRLDHNSNLDQLEAAFGALGREIYLEIKAAA